LLRCPLEQHLMEMALCRGAPAVSYHHAGANCSAGNPSPKGNPGLKHTKTATFFKKIRLKNEFQIKNKRTAGSYELQIYPKNHLQPSFLPQSHVNITLNAKKICTFCPFNAKFFVLVILIRLQLLD
jgi:hypothetical protein